MGLQHGPNVNALDGQISKWDYDAVLMQDMADGFSMRLHTRGPNVNALDGRISNATVMQS